MNPVESFIRGIKPALHEPAMNQRLVKELPRLIKNYPYLTEGIDLYDGTQFYLFFQNEEMKKKFLEDTKGIKPRSIPFHKALGLALGFPPKAVDFYCRCLQLEEEGKPEPPRVGIHYCGLNFSSDPADLTENITWLWERYQYKDILHVRIDTEMIPVEFGDLQNEILQPVRIASA